MAKQSESPSHRGRVQAQGHGTEKSQSWAQDHPPTKTDILELLQRLWESLTSEEQEARQTCYEAARQYVQQAPTTGIDAQHIRSFRNRRKRGGVRIDLEIRIGKACIDPS